MSSSVVALPILERHAELEAISSAVAAARTGSGKVVVISGPAGIGKTRLMAEARSIGAAEELMVLWARGGELDRELPWGIVRQLLDPARRSLSVGQREALFVDAGGLARPIFESEILAGTATGVQAALSYGLYWVLVGLTANRPVVLLIDDGHWADEESLRWLTYLAARLESLPVSLLVSVRTGEPGGDRPTVAALAATPSLTVLEPEPLSPEACSHLISSSLSGPPTPRFVAACRAASGGNPFLIEELLRGFLHERVKPTDTSVERVATLRSPTITRSVLLRLARLGDDAVAFARAVSVLGAGREARDAAKLAGLDPDAAARAHAGLAAAEIICPDPRPEFVHPLVRAAIYDELSALERGRWHERAARTLGEARAPVEEIVAHLLETEPGEDPWVRETLQAGARVALGRGAPELSARLLRRALRETGEQRNSAELLFELGRAEFAAEGAEGLVSLRRALNVAREPELTGQIALELGRALNSVGNHPEAAAMYAETLAALGDGPADVRRVIRANFVSTGAQAAATLPVAIASLSEAADEVGAGDPADSIILSCLALATAATGGSGAVELAEQALSSGWLLAERTPAIGFAAAALLWSDEMPRAATVWEQALAAGREHGDRPWMSFASCFCSQVAYRSGDLPAAEAHARDSLQARALWDLTPPEPASFLCEALVEQGRLAEAEEILENSGYDPSLPERQNYMTLLLARARLRLAQGRTAEAIADLRDLGRRAEESTISNPAAFPWRSTLAIALGQTAPDEAHELASVELDRARAFAAPPTLGIALRGAALTSAGDTQIDLLSEAVETLVGSHARLELARARVDLGAALRRAGHRAQARGALRQALDEANSCYAHALTARARDELLAAGARAQRGQLRGRDVLTASETRVARMAISGMSNREIAQSLFVTLRTIETHLTHVYQKLDISSREQLAAALGSATTTEYESVVQ